MRSRPQKTPAASRLARKAQRAASATKQVPPIGFRPLNPRSEPFPDRAFAYVRGYNVYATWSGRIAPDDAVGCTGALALDGTLCPGVVLPGAAVPPPQVQLLLELPLPTDERITLCCGRPTHAWVFYDDADVPVAQLVVDFRCGTWSRTAVPQSLPPETLAQLRHVCHESGRRTLAGREGGVGFFSSQERLIVEVADWKRCVDEFPTCSMPLAKLLPCMEHAMRGDPWFRRPEAKGCPAVKHCLWGGYETEIVPCTIERPGMVPCDSGHE